jgi:hypothetical protein
VFPPNSKQPVSSLQSETPIYTNDLQLELNVIKEERVRERHQLETTISDLRADRERLLKVIEEQAGTVKQLTYRPEPKAEPENKTDRPSALRLALWLVVVVAATIAAVWFWSRS